MYGEGIPWAIERQGLPEIHSFGGELEHEWHAEKDQLTLLFDRPDATVNIVCTATETGPAWQAEVTMKRGLHVSFRRV